MAQVIPVPLWMIVADQVIWAALLVTCLVLVRRLMKASTHTVLLGTMLELTTRVLDDTEGERDIAKRELARARAPRLELLPRP